MELDLQHFWRTIESRYHFKGKKLHVEIPLKLHCGKLQPMSMRYECHDQLPKLRREENREHITCGCSWAKVDWVMMLGLRATQLSSPTIEAWVNERLNELGTTSNIQDTKWNLCMITCCIWKYLCKALSSFSSTKPFEAKMPNPTDVVMEIKVHMRNM